MICVAKTDVERVQMLMFLRAHGVHVQLSEDFQAIGRLNGEGKLIGVVGFNGFCGLTCWVHDAGEKNWLSMDFLRKIFSYPFIQLGMEHLFATVAASNARALRLNRHVGFRDFARIKNGWEKDEDLIILTMAKGECRWIAEERKAA